MTKNKREREKKELMRRHSIGEWWESHSHSAFLLSLGTPQWKGVFISSVCVKRGGYEIKMYICVEKRERERETNYVQ